VRNQLGHTAVHYAVQAGAQQALAVLLAAGANPSFTSLFDCMVWDNLPKGSSPLHVAARKNEPALAMQLLKAYVSYNGKSIGVWFVILRYCCIAISQGWR
jgi:ankyrin repeat protein